VFGESVGVGEERVHRLLRGMREDLLRDEAMTSWPSSPQVRAARRGGLR
jgi:hypothetical protein